MPQMAPLAWLSLFMIFTLTFIIFNMMNYFSFITIMPKSKLVNKMYLMTSLNWKW
nr:ATP synthase F0 subunit 8 [Panzeria anthophila]